MGLTHISLSLSYAIEKSHEVLVFKTREQLKVLLNTTSEERITGPAGSGKTWLLKEKVKILAEKALLRDTKEKILVVCYSKPLSKMFLKTFEQHLVNRLPDGELSSVLEVKTFDKLLCEITGSKLGDSDREKEESVSSAVNLMKQRPAPIQRYDHVFVDECQDLYGDWPNLFKTLLKDDDELPYDDDEDDDDDDSEPKHIWFLYDTNQYLRLSEQLHRQDKLILKESHKLTEVLRNTENVSQQSRKYYKSTVRALGHCEIGLPIKWDGSLRDTAVTEREGAKVILKHIHEFRQHKVQERDICILVKNSEIRDRLSSELQRIGVESQDAEKLYEEDQNKIIVESIRRFKGLESKVVVLYNPPFCEDKDRSVKRTNELLYTAVTRCVCYLVVISTKHGCKALQSKEGIQTLDEKTSSASQQRQAGLHNPEDLESEQRSQGDALFKDPFGKRALETQYESGHPESHNKRPMEDDDDDDDGDDDDDDGIKDEPHFSPPKVSRMEEAKMRQQHKMSQQPSEQRPVEVDGCNLLEPGDPKIMDSIRNNVFKLLDGPVKQNLQYTPGTSNTNQSSPDVTAVVARIEYDVYCKRRRERNPRNYTKDLRILKSDIEKSNRTQTSHDKVARACRDSA